MKSPLVSKSISIQDQGLYSDLKVMHSLSWGWYIGTEFLTGDNIVIPGSKDSVENYESKEDAQLALDTNTFTQRK